MENCRRPNWRRTCKSTKKLRPAKGTSLAWRITTLARARADVCRCFARQLTLPRGLDGGVGAGGWARGTGTEAEDAHRQTGVGRQSHGGGGAFLLTDAPRAHHTNLKRC